MTYLVLLAIFLWPLLLRDGACFWKICDQLHRMNDQANYLVSGGAECLSGTSPEASSSFAGRSALYLLCISFSLWDVFQCSFHNQTMFTLEPVSLVSSHDF